MACVVTDSARTNLHLFCESMDSVVCFEFDRCIFVSVCPTTPDAQGGRQERRQLAITGAQAKIKELRAARRRPARIPLPPKKPDGYRKNRRRVTDAVVRCPRHASTELDCRRQACGGSPSRGDSHQCIRADECQRPAIGRERWMGGVFRSVEGSAFRLVKTAAEELIVLASVPRTRLGRRR